MHGGPFMPSSLQCVYEFHIGAHPAEHPCFIWFLELLDGMNTRRQTLKEYMIKGVRADCLIFKGVLGCEGLAIESHSSGD